MLVIPVRKDRTIRPVHFPVAKLGVLFALPVLLAVWVSAQSPAHLRADRLGLGMNLSYLDNWWLGTKDLRFSNFAKPADAAKREKMFADIADSKFDSVRVPINFGAWASLNYPFKWVNPEGLEMADRFIGWAMANKLNVIVDLHHVEFDGSVEGADSTERIVWLWKEIAERYRDRDPERVFFEIRNEPHDIDAKVWRVQAEQIITAVRAIAPKHTLVVGFHDWNSRQALIDSKPFADTNIIYTFHYYDPFIFTHQGATWSAKGLPELKDVPFPAGSGDLTVPDTAKGTWVESQVRSYRKDSNADKMFSDLKAAKDWSVKNNVPIFLGEFGSFGKHPSIEDRCRHAEAIYSALGKLNIPNAWWEWDGGFSMFDPKTKRVAGCMKKAIGLFTEQRTRK